MSTEQLRRLTYIALLIVAGVYLSERVYALYQAFGHAVMLFSLAWLLAFTLSPLVDRMVAVHIPAPFGQQRTRVVTLPRGIAVLLVYLGLLLILVGFGFYFIPLVLDQIVQLEAEVVRYANDFPQVVSSWQAYLEQHNIDFNLARALLVESQIPGNLTQLLTDWGTQIVQNIPSMLNSIAGVTIDVTIILVMSFYMTLDGPRISGRTFKFLPRDWREDARTLANMIDLRFGGWIRSLLLQGLIYGVATAVIMRVANLEFIAIASVLAGILIAIPLIGPWLAVIAPLIIALFHSPGLALGMYIALFGFQQILFHVIMPRLTGTIVGVHPLLVFLAILIGFPVGGVWGALFAIPIAGVAVSVVEFMRHKSGTTSADDEEALPEPVAPAAVSDRPAPPSEQAAPSPPIAGREPRTAGR